MREASERASRHSQHLTSVAAPQSIGSAGGGFGMLHSFTSGKTLTFNTYPLLNRTSKALLGMAVAFKTAGPRATCTNACRCVLLLLLLRAPR